MAILILSPIAAKIIVSLGSQAVKQIATVCGVYKDLKQLENTISIIQGVLVDAEEKQIHNNGVRIWLKSLGEAVHEADDLMDEFETEALRRQVMGENGLSKKVFTFFSSSNQLAFRFRMGRRISGIKKKLDVASKDRTFLILENRSHDNESGVVRRRETHSFVSLDMVIGRDNDRDEIIKLLIHSSFEENVVVIPIVGMGGLGKTTLAQSVFNDERVQQHFALKLWVCVSNPFDLKLILQTITKSKEVVLDQLQNELRKQLGGKLYLLVLDDVWEENRGKWLELENLLMGGARGSRVLLTTRSKKVAGVTSAIVPYQLGVLDEENSWSLFEKMSFRPEEKDIHIKDIPQVDKVQDINIVEIGKEIVTKCGGIPLAIRTIGSMLYFKNSELEWSSLNKEFSKIPQNKDGILPTLRLSYDNLASHLKRCFAYCSLFPKDYRIEVPTLIQLWMAQGLLHSDNNECLEDVGYRYFEDLFVRSFFQKIERNEFGDVESCKMHDLIHDLATEIAGQEYAVVNSNPPGNIDVNARYLSFHINFNSPKQVTTLLFEARKITIMLLLQQKHQENERKRNELFMGSVILKFKHIRTLDLHEMSINIVPDSIHRLKFVRYLDLSYNTNIKNLPNSITDLVNLQTLKLRGCSTLQQLPRDMKKLINLKHLDIDGCDEITHMPPGFDRLTNLIMLSNYILPKSNGYVPKHRGELKELTSLNSLRGKLVISNLKYGKVGEVELVSSSLKEKKRLASLSLHWDHTNESEAHEMSIEHINLHENLKELRLQRYGGLKISSWLQSLKNLVILSLDGCNNCKHITPMGQFSKLKKLELRRLSSLEYITYSYKEDNFSSSLKLLPSLRELELWWLPNLKGWWGEFEENQPKELPYFPQLSKLYVFDCPKLTSLPLYPHLVEDLYLYNTSWKSLQQTLMLEITSFSPLSKLKYLKLERIEDIHCLPDCFKTLTSLQKLRISNCSELKDLCPGILNLTSLKYLYISDCEDGLLDGMHNEIMWKSSLTSTLEYLWLGGFEKMESLPDGIQHLTKLQFLKIWKCDCLKTIPEWISNLKSLKQISLVSCENLISLPEAIRSLTSLVVLEIEDCPMLLKRCQMRKSEDWQNISHIPHLFLIPDPNKDSDSDDNKEKKKKKWKTK